MEHPSVANQVLSNESQVILPIQDFADVSRSEEVEKYG
jgi:hypothetical protein